MMKWTRVTIAGAIALGLALGIAIGPAFYATTTSAQTARLEQTRTGPGSAPFWNTFLDQLAAALNIQRTTLDSAIVTAGNNTIDSAVQQGNLTQAQGDALKARIQAGDLGALWGGGRGRGPGMPVLADVHQAMLDAVAQKLGITTDELFTQLRSGKTLAQIATEKGTTEQAVTSAALAAAKTRLDQAVTDGTLTQAQADAVYAQFEQKGLQLFTRRGPRFGNRGRGMMPAIPAPTATPSSTT